MGDRGLGPASDLLVVLQDTNDTVLREADQFGYRGGVVRGIRVKGPPKVGREVVEVGSRLVFWGNSLGLFGSIQPDPVEVPLGGVVGRGKEIEPTLLLIDRSPLHDVAGSRRQEAFLLPLS